MSSRTNDQRAARHLQNLTGWAYQECLRVTREMKPPAIEVLAAMRGKAIDKTDPEYAKWQRRALRLRADGTSTRSEEE